MASVVRLDVSLERLVELRGEGGGEGGALLRHPLHRRLLRMTAPLPPARVLPAVRGALLQALIGGGGEALELGRARQAVPRRRTQHPTRVAHADRREPAVRVVEVAAMLNRGAREQRV